MAAERCADKWMNMLATFRGEYLQPLKRASSKSTLLPFDIKQFKYSHLLQDLSHGFLYGTEVFLFKNSNSGNLL